MKRLNGWQMNNSRMQRHEPEMPTRWERFCYANHIDDPLAALANGKRKLILDWIHKHRDNTWIPEYLLQELAIKSRWEQ